MTITIKNEFNKTETFESIVQALESYQTYRNPIENCFTWATVEALVNTIIEMNSKLISIQVQSEKVLEATAKFEKFKPQEKIDSKTFLHLMYLAKGFIEDSTEKTLDKFFCEHYLLNGDIPVLDKVHIVYRHWFALTNEPRFQIPAERCMEEILKAPMDRLFITDMFNKEKETYLERDALKKFYMDILNKMFSHFAMARVDWFDAYKNYANELNKVNNINQEESK